MRILTTIDTILLVECDAATIDTILLVECDAMGQPVAISCTLFIAHY